MSYPQPPAGAPSPAARPKDAKALVGAILALLGAVLVLVATLGHSWFSPEEEEKGMTVGMGLWSSTCDGQACREESLSHHEMCSRLGHASDEIKLKRALFAYGSMTFYVLNWILVALFLLGSLTGFLRYGSGKSAGVPFALTLIPLLVGIVLFAAWFVVSVVASELLDEADVGAAPFLWWGGAVAVFVAVILFAKVRSAAAFGAGFRGAGGMMPPGSGVVGPQMMPPGQGVIGNPADQLGGKGQG